ncbi:MAG: hypothetical protein ACXWQO_08530 [Bdellovibrionota bacterium]
MKTLAIMTLALGFVSTAHAKSNDAALLRQIGVMKTTTHSSAPLANLKLGTPALMCNLPGETCYAEDSWQCCSGVCINQACE